MTKTEFKKVKYIAFRLAKTAFKSDRYRDWTINQLTIFFNYATESEYSKWEDWEDVYSLVSECATEVCDYVHLMCTRLERVKLDRLYERIFEDDCLDHELDAYYNFKYEIAERISNVFSICLQVAFSIVGNPWVGGVLGLTVGDLKLLYPKGFPDWFKAKFTVSLDSLPNNQRLTL